jgi:hypothetical protein
MKVTSHWFSYLFNVFSDRLSLIFKPNERSFAFVNAMEVVSTPEVLSLILHPQFPKVEVCLSMLLKCVVD